MPKCKHSREVELISTLLAISFIARNLADKILNDSENEYEGGIEHEVHECTNCGMCKGSRRRA